MKTRNRNYALLTSFCGLLVALMPADARAFNYCVETIPTEFLETDPSSLIHITDDANASQLDSDHDGFGNRCDGDYDNNGWTGSMDFVIFRGAFRSVIGSRRYIPAVDTNGDGIINGFDFLFYHGRFSRPPGPSGLGCAGNIPCE